MKKFYVSKETFKGKLVAVSVCDKVGGMESEHARFEVNPTMTESEAYCAAIAERDRLNSSAA